MEQPGIDYREAVVDMEVFHRMHVDGNFTSVKACVALGVLVDGEAPEVGIEGDVGRYDLFGEDEVVDLVGKDCSLDGDDIGGIVEADVDLP